MTTFYITGQAYTVPSPRLLNPSEASIRKVGGIWFMRAWRIRISFYIARQR